MENIGPSAGPQFEEPTPEEAPSTSPDVANTTDILTNAAKAAGATLPEATEAAMNVAAELKRDTTPIDS